jgi:hypothetical protein
MPIYVYEIVQPDGSEGPRFEIAQGMKEPPLTKHPETGEPVRRAIVPVAIGGSWTESSMNKRMKDDKRLGELGFTKYVKAGDGVYEKRAGKGPQIIDKNNRITAKDLKHLD